VYPNTSASEAGLTARLIVLKIDGIPTQGKTLAECASIGKGPAGEKVRMELKDPQRAETRTIELTRRKFVAGS
jgi:C-terminal processing protease CtpA/Prc